MSPRIAPYLCSLPPFLHVLVDAALPIRAERPVGADAANGLADDLVVQRRARAVAFVAHGAIRVDAEARRLPRRVDVRAEEEEFLSLAASMFAPRKRNSQP